MTPEGRSLSFGQCEVNGVSFRELRDHFTAIKDDVQSQDKRTDIKLLKESILLNVSTSESCCLLRHLLRFYVENIFRNYNVTSNILRRKSSILANAFLSIKTTLKQCHDQNRCSCGQESHKRYKLLLEEYAKLDKNAATSKALGEIDILFAWMESF
ncbi:interleukin-20-like [Thamnophis elegans]|uniref:interleukin-20-like n=1 Tax=Thamnophis elegans TaxID=35005 RepID=UPI001376BF8C|nr:interleukin-20-like [Thamnophis elegans]